MYVVVAEVVSPVEQLVEVDSCIALRVFVSTSVHVLSVAADRSIELGSGGVEQVVCTVEGELEVVQECPLEISACRKVVAEGRTLVPHSHGIRVLVRTVRTIVTEVV